MHDNELPFINGGQDVSGAPESSIGQSLAVIISSLAITTIASLLKSRKDIALEDTSRENNGASRVD